MKKLLFAAVMMLASSAAFAGDSDPLKAILKSKNYNEASMLLQNSLNQLANNQEKAKAYDHLARLALEKFDKENNIQAQNIQAKMLKQKEQSYDTVGFYQAAYYATIAAVECNKYDNMPNEKGKVNPKFIEKLAPLVANARLQLVNAGNDYAGKGDQEGVLKYWGTFLDTDDLPMFASTKSAETQFIGQVALYSAQFANQAKQYERAEKYCDIAMQDSSMRQQAQNFKFAMAQRNLKTKADSLAFADKMKAELEKDPNNETVFDVLSNIYSGLGMDDELTKLIDNKLASDPNSFSAWALKGQLEMNKNSKAEVPNWDSSIDCFKKAVAISQTNPVVYTYLGFCINAKASQVNGNAAAQKELYKEAAGYLEKAKELDPNRERANWAYPMYQCAYQLYGATDSRTVELETMLKQH